MRSQLKKILPLLLLAATMAHAVPMIYTFSGTTGGVGNDVIDDRGWSGLYWSNNIRYNMPVEYKFLIDFDRDGVVIQPDGSEGLPESHGNPIYSFFYARYLSGEFILDLFHGTYLFPGDSARSYSAPSFHANNEFGVDLLLPSEYGARLLTRPSVWANLDLVSANKKHAEDWEIGDPFFTLEYIENPMFVEYSIFLNVNLTLTDISPESPASIPEPNSILLMLIGLVVVLAHNFVGKKDLIS